MDAGRKSNRTRRLPRGGNWAQRIAKQLDELLREPAEGMAGTKFRAMLEKLVDSAVTGDLRALGLLLATLERVPEMTLADVQAQREAAEKVHKRIMELVETARQEGAAAALASVNGTAAAPAP